MDKSKDFSETELLYAEQVKQLYKHTPIGIIATLINCSLLGFILWKVIPHSALTIWLAACALVSFFRYLLFLRFWRSEQTPTESSRQAMWLDISLAFSGIVWGSAGIFLFPMDSIGHQIFIAFVLGGMVAGAAGTFSIILRTFIAYSLPALLPIILRFFTIGDQIHLTMGGMTLLFGILMFSTAKRINRATVSSLKLKFENKDLIHRLEHRVQERTTDHKRAEEQLKTERAKFEIMLRQLPVGVIIAEAESGKTIYSNAQVARIWKQKFPVSNSIEDYVQYKGFHPDGRPYLSHEWPLSRSLTEGEIVKEEEINFQRGDGSFGWMSVNSTPILDDEGHVIAGIVTFSDISERKKSEEILNRYRAELELEVSNRTAEIQGQYRELEKLNATIRQLSRKTIEAMENDRKALSKEIHDSIAGTLSAIKMLLEAHIEHAAQNSASNILPLEEITKHLGDAIKETREISFQLRSRTLDDFGLKAAIFEHFQQFRKFYPEIRIVPEIEIADERIADDIQTVLYRVVQEALNNVGKHSSATQVHVKLINNQNQIWMKISDNGCGFDINKLMSSNQSIMYYGIHSMRERVELCKGKIEIHSEHGKGTDIDISIPI